MVMGLEWRMVQAINTLAHGSRPNRSLHVRPYQDNKLREMQQVATTRLVACHPFFHRLLYLFHNRTLSQRIH
jgi:hypothetical protein